MAAKRKKSWPCYMVRRLIGATYKLDSPRDSTYDKGDGVILSYADLQPGALCYDCGVLSVKLPSGELYYIRGLVDGVPPHINVSFIYYLDPQFNEWEGYIKSGVLYRRKSSSPGDG